MTQFLEMRPNSEVLGAAILAFVDGLGASRKAAIRILEKYNIYEPRADKWYSMQAWLDAFKVISNTMGRAVLFSIGKSIPEKAEWPPGVDSIEKGLASIDVAYHMNHRINGIALFDPSTGVMKEGIGHYKFEKINDRTIKVICNNPYPCDFDRGIITGVARKFKSKDITLITVTHDDTNGCRKDGAYSCKYLIKW